MLTGLRGKKCDTFQPVCLSRFTYKRATVMLDCWRIYVFSRYVRNLWSETLSWLVSLLPIMQLFGSLAVQRNHDVISRPIGQPIVWNLIFTADLLSSARNATLFFICGRKSPKEEHLKITPIISSSNTALLHSVPLAAERRIVSQLLLFRDWWYGLMSSVWVVRFVAIATSEPAISYLTLRQQDHYSQVEP